MTPAKTAHIDPSTTSPGDTNIFGFNFSFEESNIILLNAPWDATTSYRPGTANGPKAIHQASEQLDFFHLPTSPNGLSFPWKFGIHLQEAHQDFSHWNTEARKHAEKIIEVCGDAKLIAKKNLSPSLDKVNELSTTVHRTIEEKTLEVIRHNKIPGVIGGEHSVSYGAVKAIARHTKEFGVLQIDAHADLRQAYEGFQHSHASISYNLLRDIPEICSLVQVGVRDFCNEEYQLSKSHSKVKTFYDVDLHKRQYQGENWHTICSEIINKLPASVYVTFDIDGLDPSLCPHTGTPVPGGLSYNQAIYLLLQITLSGRHILGFDITEVSPSDTIPHDEWDGNVGARLLYHLCAVTLHSNGARDVKP